MQVPNDEWTAVVSGTPDKFIVQNVGDTRIGFTVAATPPGDEDPVDNGTHGLFLPGSNPFNMIDLDTDGLTLYVRSLGPKNGQLFVSDEETP